MLDSVRKKITDVTENDIGTVIGKDAVIIGNINGNGNLLIDGSVNGDISYTGSIVIGENGRVKGNISASELSVAGTIEGNVEIVTLLTLYSSGQLLGDIDAGNLVIHPGAVFQGRSNMNPQNDMVFNL